MELRNGVTNSVKLEFLSTTENISFARNIGACFIQGINPTISFIQEIKTIISEAVTNAIIHGYEGKSDCLVKMNLIHDNNYLYMEISDDGIGIVNLEEAKMPLFTTKANDERSGLGFTIMEVFADLFDCETAPGKGTTIKIQKKLPAREVIEAECA